VPEEENIDANSGSIDDEIIIVDDGLIDDQSSTTHHLKKPETSLFRLFLLKFWDFLDLFSEYSYFSV